MKRFFKYLLILLAIAALVVFVVGYRLPEEHTATAEREYAATPERVFAEISTPREYPRWRSGVQRVEMLPADSTGRVLFREHGLGDATTYEILENTPNRLFVTAIADEDLPYAGTWTFALEPTAGGTLVRITEDGIVFNPIFRFVSRYVMGHRRGIESYLSDLDARLGSAPPTP